MRTDRKGMTLIEVMIAVVIVGILAAVAIPSYTSYVSRTRRADAVTALETVALYEEKAFAEAGTYETLADLMAHRRMPDVNAQSRYYEIDVDPLGSYAEGFIATATPVNEQADDDTVFGIDSNGNRGTVSGGAVVVNQDLWNSLRR